MTISEMIHEIPHMRYRLESAKHKETLDEIEEVLRHYKEQDNDLISRQAVLDRKYVVEVKNMWHMTEEIEVVNVDDIKALPSVNPQEPKTGYWIGVNPMVDTLMCSECGENIISEEFKSNYCPNCGCRMVEPQESEEV